MFQGVLVANDIPEMQEMTDIAFDLGGSSVSADYSFALWRELVRCLPWLESEKLAGVHPLRLVTSGAEMLLARRAKLVLRMPVARIAQAGQLTGQELDIASGVLAVGAAKERPLQSHPTLHAHMVESSAEEEIFVADVARQLRDMKINCKLICGKREILSGEERAIAGYSLVLHELRPDESLYLQRHGLGGERRYGFGIFVPYKVISGLG